MAKPQQPDLTLSAGHDADWWAKEVSCSVRGWKDYRDRARKVIDRFRDERKDEIARSSKRFNILYSNTETLGPAIYSQVPTPDVRRRFRDKDDIGRLAATILQRALAYCLQSYDFDGVLDRCKQDYLLPGFAIARVLYKPYFKQGEAVPESPAEDAAEGGEQAAPKVQAAAPEELVYEEAATDYVSWDRFAMSRSRTYEKVWWGAIADDLTKDEVRAQFGEDVVGKLSFSRKDDDANDAEAGSGDGKVRIWEVWNKRGRSRFFLAEGYNDWVRAPESDPLRLEGFFPWPKPIWSIATNDTLIPIPEYCEYQDQAMELDDLTERIDVLTSALRRRGVYDAASKDKLAGLVNAGDNQFEPIENWQALMEKGGLANIVAELPIDGIAKIVLQLHERREAVKQTIYEVTGIADIVRGASNPNETLGAQQLKGRWAGLRISSRQKKFANFARDIVRLKAEIIADRFSQQTLAVMSGVQIPTVAEKARFAQMQQAAQAQQAQYQQFAQQAQQAGQQPPAPPPPFQVTPEQQQYFAQPAWEDVLRVLRNDKLRGFKVDIETDSTVQPDADAEKQARTELLTAIGQFSQQMGAAVQQGFVPPPLAVSLIKFALRSFKVDSEVEQELEAMGQNTTPPQIAQMQQQLQQREQAVQQAEAKAKDDQHRAQLARKDVEIAQARAEKVRSDAESKQAMLDMRLGHAEDVAALHGKHQQQLMDLVTRAEEAVRAIAVMDQEQKQPVPPPEPQAPEPAPQGV